MWCSSRRFSTAVKWILTLPVKPFGRDMQSGTRWPFTHSARSWRSQGGATRRRAELEAVIRVPPAASLFPFTPLRTAPTSSPRTQGSAPLSFWFPPSTPLTNVTFAINPPLLTGAEEFLHAPRRLLQTAAASHSLGCIYENTRDYLWLHQTPFPSPGEFHKQRVFFFFNSSCKCKTVTAHMTQDISQPLRKVGDTWKKF